VQVTVRYSLDNWSTYDDQTATYLPPDGANTGRYDGGLTDTFTFQLRLPSNIETSCAGGHLQFSVRFKVGPAGDDATFWDSNFGRNYVFDWVPVVDVAET